ncbi:Hsp70 family protein [Candidatus Dojkabacteria bacterium]|uniref:Hsp70 family protein n=1 Tax=Candidatus Dojkabacteria bacterium TaxID=2099670 RepID=A0A3M0YXN2_9BACT|nr:MAG: Hsp70 family protein [Candidatus Dojkabacteria bacterium]
MRRTKIDYGIDLGTTNSAIARMENGEPIIKKTDTLKDTMPSCISFNKKQLILVGDAAVNALKQDKLRAMKDFRKESSNTFIEFKRTMGSDKTYHSSNMNRAYTSEELSAEVLKKLKSFIIDEEIKSIVITVPAKFTINQKDATLRAAKLAGFEHCELLQEPIAASMAYGLDATIKHGYWLVFDFGGGTFDAALIKVEDGIMRVIDTEGDNYLGGKNIDYSIVDEIIIPYLQRNFSINSIISNDSKREILREAMKYYAEEAKIQLSFKETYNILSDLGDIPGTDDEGNEFELDITISRADLEKVVRPIFQKAIDICKDLLKRNHLSGKDLGSLILVGGPTYSPILRKMLKEQITEKVDVSCDPMTVVARGAALYASTVDISEEIIEKSRDKTKIQLKLGYEPTTVENTEFVTVKILKNDAEDPIPNKCFLEVVRTDKAWSSGKITISEQGEIVEVKLNEGKANAFNVFVYDELGNLIPSEPNEFTIIQGSKVGSATLPYHIGIEVKSKSSGKVIFRPIRGLEKNQTLPATGTINGLKTQKQINPGSKSDFIKIPIYQGDHGSEGSRAIYNEHVYDVIITGEDLPSFLPENSDVDLIVKVDKSERITLSAFFPYLNFTQDVEVPINSTQKEIDANWLENELSKAKQMLNLMRQESDAIDKDLLNKLSDDLSELEKLLRQGRSDYDRKKQVLESLRRCLRKLDEIQDSVEWPKTEEELKKAFYDLEKAFKELKGELDDLNKKRIEENILQFKDQTIQVIKDKDVKTAREMIDLMQSLTLAIVDQALGVQMEIMILQQLNEKFDTHEWSDRNKAKILISQGLQMAITNPNKQRLRGVLVELFKLLPNTKNSMFPPDDSLLIN